MQLEAQQHEPTLLKMHPTLSLWRMIQRWALTCIGVLIITGVILFIHYAHSATVLQYFWHFYYPYALAICISLSNLAVPFNNEIRFWRQMEQRRQRAVRNDARLLSDLQPPPDAYALTLPLIIERQREGMPRRTFFIVVVLTTLGINAFGIFMATLSSSSGIYFITLGILFLIIMSIRRWVEGLKAQEKLIVTEEGLWKSSFSFIYLAWQWHYLSWQEAHLLAIDDTIHASSYPTAFELAGTNGVVHWKWQRYHKDKGKNINPPVCPDEYDQIMFRLLSLIMARTGLPLYDLRKKL